MSYQPDLNATIRSIGLATLYAFGLMQIATAQQPSDPMVRRQSSGWRATEKLTIPQVQTAYFQAQDGLSDGPPVLPSSGPAMPYGAVGMPAFPTSTSSPAIAGSTSVNPPVNPPSAVAPPQLPLPHRGSPGFIPAGDGQPGNAPDYGNGQDYNIRPSYGARANVDPQSNYPPANRPIPAKLASGEVRPIQGERSPVRNEAPANANTGLREQGASAASQANDGRLDPNGFTSGLPFVTPAPRGRYATSPYQAAIFQSADYRPLSVPVQFVSNATAAPQAYVAPQPTSTATSTTTQAVLPPSATAVAGTTPPYLTPQQAGLPQFRYPQTGIYQTAYQCTPPGPTVPSTGAVPGAYIPPTLPPNLTPNLYSPNNSGYTPLFSLGQENYNVQLGRGIIGQPTVYVAGQPIRNFMRYLSP